MRLFCQLQRHQLNGYEVWNDGHFFSFCKRCGTDMVRRPGRRWRAVRAPNKVVWKPRQPFDMPWRPDGAPIQPSDEVPVAAEWRALIDRSQRAAEQAPPRPLRWAEETPVPAREVSPAALSSG